MSESNTGRSERDSRIIQSLVELADTLIDEFDVIELLNTLSSRCVELLDVDEAGILLADGRGSLAVVATSGERVRLLEVFEAQQREGPSFEAYVGGHDVFRNDLVDDPQRWPAFSQRAESLGFRAVHSVPLRLRSEIIGALNLLRTAVGGLTADDVLIAHALADVATIGLLQQRAISDSKVTARQLQNALQSRVRIEQAKGVIAERHGVDIDTAFDRLRDYSRRNGQRLTDVADRVVRNDLDMAELDLPREADGEQT